MTLCRAEGDNVVYMNPADKNTYQVKTKQELESRIKNKEAGEHFNVIAIYDTK